jgi:hypothetical protein
MSGAAALVGDLRSSTALAERSGDGAFAHAILSPANAGKVASP